MKFLLKKVSFLVKHNLKHYLHYSWMKRYVILCSLVSIFILCNLILHIWYHIWYLKLRPDEPSILCSFGKGRLENQMSSLATMYSFARKYGLRYFVTKEQYNQLTYYFEPESLAFAVLEHDLPHYFVTMFGYKFSRLYWEKPWDRIDNIDNNFNYHKMHADKKLHTGKVLNIGDFPNEVQTYAKYLPDLRKRFNLRQRFKERAQDILHAELMRRNMIGSDITWVGVHNRRGDYKSHLGSLYGLSLLEADYFHQAMKIFTNDYSHVIFVVVTDDMEWAQQNMKFPGIQVAFLGHSKVLEKDVRHPLAAADDIGDDLALLAACNHTIMSYGTFGQWAALLAGGRVVISDTAAGTKEGRELTEGGFGPGADNWIWLQSKTNEKSLVKSGGEMPSISKCIVIILFMFFSLFESKQEQFL